MFYFLFLINVSNAKDKKSKDLTPSLFKLKKLTYCIRSLVTSRTHTKDKEREGTKKKHTASTQNWNPTGIK